MTDISLCLKGCNHQRGVNRMTTELEKLIAENEMKVVSMPLPEKYMDQLWFPLAGDESQDQSFKQAWEECCKTNAKVIATIQRDATEDYRSVTMNANRLAAVCRVLVDGYNTAIAKILDVTDRSDKAYNILFEALAQAEAIAKGTVSNTNEEIEG